MLTLAISALSFASSPITQAPAGAASDVDCDAMCGKDSACSEWSSCTDAADDAGAMAQVLGENCYMPWPPSGWPPSWVCPTASGPPAAGGDPEGKECSTLTEPGGPAYEGIPKNYWGSISMDSNIIDKSDDIVAQLVAQGPELYPKGTLADYKATGKVWGKTSLEWEALGFICQVPTDDDLTICNGRGDAEAENDMCNDGGRGADGSDAAAACIVKTAGTKALCAGYGQDCFDCGPRPKLPYEWKANTR